MQTPGEKNNQNAEVGVLLVEDNFYTRDIIHIALTKNGYRVIDAEDGVVAEKILTDTKRVGNIDCIILDRLMPHMDGYALLARIKQNPGTAHIPVIILSDLESDEDVEEGKRLGAATYLVKVRNVPFGIVEKVSQLLKRTVTAESPSGTTTHPVESS